MPPTVISADGSYEWDADKDCVNRREHQGVSFPEAATALESPTVQVSDDGSASGRLRGIGYSIKGRLLTVVLEERGERDRIISAWRSISAERRQFSARGV